MKLIPSKKQWGNWSLPSKLTAIGAYLAIISLIIFIITTLSDLFRPQDDLSEIKKEMKKEIERLNFPFEDKIRGGIGFLKYSPKTRHSNKVEKA